MPASLYEEPLNIHELGPKNRAVLVTPSDSADLARPALALYVGGAGNINLVTTGGDTVLFTAVPVGTVLNLRIARVKATDTTATNLVAMS